MVGGFFLVLKGKLLDLQFCILNTTSILLVLGFFFTSLSDKISSNIFKNITDNLFKFLSVYVAIQW